MPGMDETRADIIVTGAVVLDTVLRADSASRSWCCANGRCARASCSTTCRATARAVARAEAYPDVRRRSVVGAGRALRGRRQAHGKHVARLALELFDGTRRLPRAGRRGALAPGVRRAAARHRPSHLLPGPPQAHVLPHQERRTCAASTRSRSRCWRTWPATIAAATRGASTTAFGVAVPRGPRDGAHAGRAAARGGRAGPQPPAGGAQPRRQRPRPLAAASAARPSGDSELELWGVPRRAELLEEVLGVPVRVKVVAARSARAARARRRA